MKQETTYPVSRQHTRWQDRQHRKALDRRLRLRLRNEKRRQNGLPLLSNIDGY